MPPTLAANTPVGSQFYHVNSSADDYGLPVTRCTLSINDIWITKQKCYSKDDDIRWLIAIISVPTSNCIIIDIRYVLPNLNIYQFQR